MDDYFVHIIQFGRISFPDHNASDHVIKIIIKKTTSFTTSSTICNNNNDFNAWMLPFFQG